MTYTKILILVHHNYTFILDLNKKYFQQMHNFFLSMYPNFLRPSVLFFVPLPYLHPSTHLPSRRVTPRVKICNWMALLSVTIERRKFKIRTFCCLIFRGRKTCATRVKNLLEECCSSPTTPGLWREIEFINFLTVKVIWVYIFARKLRQFIIEVKY